MKKLLREVWRERGADGIEAGVFIFLVLLLLSLPTVMAWGVIEGVGNIPNSKMGLGYETTHLILPAAGVGLLAGGAYFAFFLIPALIGEFKRQLAHKIDQTMDEPVDDWQHKVA